MGQKTNKYIAGINFGFNDNKFYVEYAGCVRPVGNLRQEFEIRARDLHKNFSSLCVSLSSGLDSQSVLHSFYTQKLPVKCAFLYMPGFNETEFANIQTLKNKYDVEFIVVEMDPMAIKDEVMHLHEQLKLPPNQIIHRKFLEQLPDDLNLIQGIHGPDLLFKDEKWFMLESANSFEISRLRAQQSIQGRMGGVIGWERTSEILLSILTDDTTLAFMHAYNYISNNKLIYQDGSEIPIIDYWDLYIKPFIYGKYWKDELEYFPKIQGVEGIDYIENGPRNQMQKNLTAVSYLRLVDHLRNPHGGFLRISEIS